MQTQTAPQARERSEPHNHSLYALTLKHTNGNNHITSNELNEVMNKIIESNKRYDISVCRQVFELDSRNRLHIHALLGAKPHAFIKQMKGFHIHLESLDSKEDIIKWNNYMNKQNQDEVLQDNIFSNVYCFDKTKLVL